MPVSVRQQIISLLRQSPSPVAAPYLTASIKVNKSSIYRQLQSLVAKGLVTEVDFGDGKKHYELSSTGHHHHLVCLKCQSVSDVNLSSDLDREEQLIETNLSFKVLRHQLEFFGHCAKCK